MEREIKNLIEEIEEISKFEATTSLDDIQSISGLCGGFLTVICC